MLQKLIEILNMTVTIQLSVPGILCWTALIPFVLILLVNATSASLLTKAKVETVCSAIQTLLFMVAVIIWAIIEHKLHCIATELGVVWGLITLASINLWRQEAKDEKEG